MSGETGRIPGPCPFCHTAEEVYLDENPNKSRPRYWVVCAVCEATGPVRKTEDDAVNDWNRVLFATT